MTGSRRDTADRKYTDLQVEASLQLSIYSHATSMNGLADQEDLPFRFDVLIKTKRSELHRSWTTRDRGERAAVPAGRRGPPIDPPTIEERADRSASWCAGIGITCDR
jgi:hypothetical protein